MRYLLTGVVATLVVSTSWAQQDSWSPEFHHPGLGTASRVFALAVYRGELIAGGKVGRGHGRFLPGGVARYDPRTRTWNGLPGGGLSMDGRSRQGQARAFAVYNNELVIGGQFNFAGGVPARNVARWDGKRFQPLGTGIGLPSNNFVHALAVYKGKLYAAGEFFSAGTAAARNLAVWDGVRWSGVGTGLTHRRVSSGGHALLVASDGSMYVGGTFDSAAGVPAANVARFDGARFAPLASGTDGMVRALAEWNGKIYAGGRFGKAGGLPNTSTVAAWDGRAWSALASGIRNPTFTEVMSLHAHGNSLYAGGRFFSVGTLQAKHVVRWDGARFHDIGGVAGTAFPAFAPFVFAMTSLGNELVVGGEFWRVGGPRDPTKSLVSRSVAAVDPATARWRQLGRGLGLAVNPRVFDMVTWRGSTVVAGEFQMAGSRTTSGLVRFTGNDWQDLGLPYGRAQALAVLGDDLYVGVGTSSGQPGVLRYDGARWSPVGTTGATLDLAFYKGRLYKNGDGSIIAWTGSAWQRVGPSFIGSARVLHVHGGLLYVGGSMRGAGISRGVFAFDGSKAVALGSGVQGTVTALGSFGGDLVVGGTFTQAGSVTLTAGVARWNGKVWSALDAGFPRLATPLDFTVLNGELYAGGSGFGVARMRSGSWQVLRDGPIGGAAVLHADPRTGQLWVGGTFHSSATMPMDGIARLSTRIDWRDLGAALAGSRGQPVLSGHGPLSAGGRVTFLLRNARARAVGLHAFGGVRIDQPLFGGILVPRPDVSLPFTTDRFGTTSLGLTLPGVVPPGVDVFVQSWLVDAAGPLGFAAANAIASRSR